MSFGSKFDGLLNLVNKYIVHVDCGKYENISYMIVAQDLVYNSIFKSSLGESNAYLVNEW